GLDEADAGHQVQQRHEVHAHDKSPRDTSAFMPRRDSGMRKAGMHSVLGGDMSLPLCWMK
ncbi:hypothetical protein, partial [Azohydromonas australica]|uniref:hypothetical protein n=1 Tax=Azohydromonas australica TaxID=364039 RepID=UPI001B7FC6F9